MNKVPKIIIFMMLLLGVVGTHYEEIKTGIVDSFPIRYVRVTGTFQYLLKSDVKKVTGVAVQESFLTVDIIAIRKAVEGLPWVDSATVSRVWPDIIDIHVVEQSVVAYWGHDQLLNDRGELFKPTTLAGMNDLPVLIGPTEAYQRVFELLGRVQINVENTDLALTTLVVSPQYAVSAVFENGLKVQLGSEKPIERLNRFIGVYDRMKSNANGLMRRVDMRYHNGFSVAWK
ncbi:MAG: FtsQ-type POTRA domain-containing protein [Methylococcales bacterium]|jgi:cell division protein FtsQ